MHLLFVRHGQSVANIEEIFANRVDAAYPLTLRGREQAGELARTLASEPISHVYTSPLLRARETAEVVAAPRRWPVHLAPALREYDVGEFEYLPYGGAHAWRMARYRENEARWRRGDLEHRLAGGESLGELHERLQGFLRYLAAHHDATETLLLVGHGGLFRVALPLVLVNLTPEAAHHQPIDHGTVIRVSMSGVEARCERWGQNYLP